MPLPPLDLLDTNIFAHFVRRRLRVVAISGESGSLRDQGGSPPDLSGECRLVRPWVISLHGGGVDDGDAGGAGEVGPVQGQDVGNAVGLHQGSQLGVVDLVCPGPRV